MFLIYDNKRIMIQILKTIDEFNILFTSIEKYDFYYLSIGSKFNNNINSNATLQMIPNFLVHCSKKILIIVVDIFNEIELIKNIDILTLGIGSDKDIILLNHSFTEDVILLFLKYIDMNNIIPTNCMIVNFVKFLSPNESEHSIEQYISTMVRNITKTHFDAKYQNVFYQWFGYNEFYNIIYNDNLYPLHCHIFVYSWIVKHSSLSKPLNYYELHLLKTNYLNLICFQQQKIKGCFNYCIDIQSYTTSTTVDDYFTSLFHYLIK
jgi:hypothetical protein